MDLCETLRAECGGRFTVCLDMTQSLCTCFCPCDKKSALCKEYRDYK